MGYFSPTDGSAGFSFYNWIQLLKPSVKTSFNLSTLSACGKRGERKNFKDCATMFESSQLAQKETALSIMPSNIPHFMSGPRGHGVMDVVSAHSAN